MVLRRAFVATVWCTLLASTPLPVRAGAAQPVRSAQPESPSTLHDGPWIGTWKRRNPTPSPETWIMKWWKEGDGLRYTIDVTRPAGAPTHMEAFVRFDGRPYSEVGNPSADHNIFERIDDRTLVLRDMKDGKETIRFRITYSADGRVRTSVSSRTNANGETVTSTGVWDRVR